MLAQASVFSYFWQAGLVVKSVMFILLIASVFSWTLIIQRAWYFNQRNKQYKLFYNSFWQSKDLTDLYSQLKRNKSEGGLDRIFECGFKEFLRQSKLKKIDLERVQQAMQIQNSKELELLEQHLPLFASTGSISPYIGLFGTVWGIMTSFQALGHAQQATIAMVAPGISEALVATALGLFTAIPAVIAYNRYSSRANFLLARYELFQEEFISLIAEQTEPQENEGQHA